MRNRINILMLLLTFFISCSGQKKIQKLRIKHPELFKTEQQNISIRTNTNADTLTKQFEWPREGFKMASELIFEVENEKQRAIFSIKDSVPTLTTIYKGEEVKADTVIQQEKIIVEPPQPKLVQKAQGFIIVVVSAILIGWFVVALIKARKQPKS